VDLVPRTPQGEASFAYLDRREDLITLVSRNETGHPTRKYLEPVHITRKRLDGSLGPLSNTGDEGGGRVEFRNHVDAFAGPYRHVVEFSDGPADHPVVRR
jgi:hypothetical protein